MKTGRNSTLSENQVVDIWQQTLASQQALVTEDGESITVVYPGRINDDQGADFRDAVIATSRGLVTGDIEIHVRSSNWWQHGHHRNSAYNRVILHVVFWHDTSRGACLQNGGQVPVLALSRYPGVPGMNPVGSLHTPALPCFRAPERSVRVAELLDRAGEARFLARAAGFREDLNSLEGGQCLYRGLMGALGYVKNTLPFLELSRRLPLAKLETIAGEGTPDPECLARLQALLLGTAGLLSAAAGNRLAELTGLWSADVHPEAMSPLAWQRFKVRPQNSPVNRLLAMAYILVRCREQGLLTALIDRVEQTPLNHGDLWLKQALLVTDVETQYRALPEAGRALTLLGSDRAALIIINVLLPFTYAWSESHTYPDLGQKAFQLYCRYPPAALNSVEQHMMRQLNLNAGIIGTARRQQGLLHIYRSYCIRGGCPACPLGQLEPRHDV